MTVADVISARLGKDRLQRRDDARGDASRGAWLADPVTRELNAAAGGHGGHVATAQEGAIGTLGRGTPTWRLLLHPALPGTSTPRSTDCAS